MQAMHEVEWSRSEKYSLRDLADPGSTMQYDAAGNSCVTEGVDSDSKGILWDPDEIWALRCFFNLFDLNLRLLGTKYLRTIFQVNVPWKDCAMLLRFEDLRVMECHHRMNGPGWPHFDRHGCVPFVQIVPSRWRMTSMMTS